MCISAPVEGSTVGGPWLTWLYPVSRPVLCWALRVHERHKFNVWRRELWTSHWFSDSIESSALCNFKWLESDSFSSNCVISIGKLTWVISKWVTIFKTGNDSIESFPVLKTVTWVMTHYKTYGTVSHSIESFPVLKIVTRVMTCNTTLVETVTRSVGW